jgi:3-oxoacyl-[acyl-carrier-protein (ACP)] synthase III-like protein
LAAGTFERILLVASDTTTRHLAAEDVHTRILFGDGAAALLLENDVRRGIALRSWVAGSDGAGATMFHVPDGESTVSMHGRELFRFATERGCEVLREACSLAQLSAHEITSVTRMLNCTPSSVRRRQLVVSASGIFMLTGHGRDVVLPKFTEIDIMFDRPASLHGTQLPPAAVSRVQSTTGQWNMEQLSH